MNFKIIPTDEVTLYLHRSIETTKNDERRKNIKSLLDKLDKGLKAYHGFENEYGEKYLMLGYDLEDWWWAGDESDWEEADSYYENKFVMEILEAERNNIVKKQK